MLSVSPERWSLLPSVAVNIASARLSNDDNLLDCQVIDMPLAEARRAPNTLRCGLIYGDQESPSNG